MESAQVRQSPPHGTIEDAATTRQLHYIAALATKLGFYCSTTQMTKEEAAQKIEQLKAILNRDTYQKNRERDIKLSMAKKLIYRKWIEKDQEINKQTEKRFIEEVAYLNTVFEKIDQALLAEHGV